MTVGVGFTVIVKDIGVPVQVCPAKLKDGVTVIVAVIGAFVVFVAVNTGIFPVPEAPRLILVLLLVQEKVVPETEPVKLMTSVSVPLHLTWLETAETVGIGFTVRLKFV